MQVTGHPSAAAVNSTYHRYDSPLQGMKKARQQVDDAAQKIASGSTDAGDVVQLIHGEKSFQANVAALKTADEMVGTILNTFA